jgi:hypothetical protein
VFQTTFSQGFSAGIDLALEEIQRNYLGAVFLRVSLNYAVLLNKCRVRKIVSWRMSRFDEIAKLVNSLKERLILF